jgi:beta-phosphoglucomutase
MAYGGAISDVDGVLVDSPPELGWREAPNGLMEGEWRDIRGQTSWTPQRFTSAVCQQLMAGMPRLAGSRAERYTAAKPEHLVIFFSLERLR